FRDLTAQLADKCQMIALTPPDPSTLNAETARRIAHAAGARLTVVRSDGVVLVDSEADAAKMQNHRDAGRPELLAAFAGRVGWDERRSVTLGVPFLYAAVPVKDGSMAVRLAAPLNTIDEQVNAIRGKLLASTAIAFLPAVLVAAIFARYSSRRFASIMSHAG